MAEFETDLGKISFDEVERIIKQEGDISIMRFRSQRREALEELIAFLRDSGTFTPVEGYEEQRGIKEAENVTGNAPITVYLSCPVSRSDSNESSLN